MADLGRADDERRVGHDPVEAASGHRLEPGAVDHLGVRASGAGQGGAGELEGAVEHVGGGDLLGETGLGQRLHAAAAAEVEQGADGGVRHRAQQGQAGLAHAGHVVQALLGVGDRGVAVGEDDAVGAVQVDGAHVDERAQCASGGDGAGTAGVGTRGVVNRGGLEDAGGNQRGDKIGTEDLGELRLGYRLAQQEGAHGHLEVGRGALEGPGDGGRLAAVQGGDGLAVEGVVEAGLGEAELDEAGGQARGGAGEVVGRGVGSGHLLGLQFGSSMVGWGSSVACARPGPSSRYRAPSSCSACCAATARRYSRAAAGL